MSRNNSESGFYFRGGHQSVLMEVFQVLDQMLRRAVPRLEFEWNMRVGEVSRANIKRGIVPASVESILRNK